MWIYQLSIIIILNYELILLCDIRNDICIHMFFYLWNTIIKFKCFPNSLALCYLRMNIAMHENIVIIHYTFLIICIFYEQFYISEISFENEVKPRNIHTVLYFLLSIAICNMGMRLKLHINVSIHSQCGCYINVCNFFSLCNYIINSTSILNWFK